jgi:hypothetical protein
MYEPSAARNGNWYADAEIALNARNFRRKPFLNE